MKLLATVVSMFAFSTTAHAVPVELPTDGWYQLQDKTSFDTLCTSSGDMCDVAAGTYILINHSTGVRNSSFVVEDTTPAPIAGPTVVHQPATYQFARPDTLLDPAIPVESYFIGCPTNTSIVSGSCEFFGFSSSESVGGNSLESLTVHAKISPEMNGLMCVVGDDVVGSDYDLVATGHGVATCIAGSSDTLPRIEETR